MRHVVKPIAFLVVASFLAAPIAAQDSPPCQAEDDQSLDFWLGDWVVEVGAGSSMSSTVTASNGNCLVRERRSLGGDEVGTSTSYYDPSTNRWRQLWVFEDGRLLQLEGARVGDALHLEGLAIGSDGASRTATAELTNESAGVTLTVAIEGEPGAVRLEFGPRTEAEPVAQAPAPATPTPTPTPTPAPPMEPAAVDPDEGPSGEPPGTVSENLTIPSRQVSREDTRVVRADLESPAVFELRSGALDKLPKGYSWSSTETAGYLCEGAELRRITVTPKVGKKNVDVDLTAYLFGRQFTQRVDLTVEFVGADQNVVAATTGFTKVGRSITDNREDGVRLDLELEMSRESFDQLFDAGQRPVLRLTLDCMP